MRIPSSKQRTKNMESSKSPQNGASDQKDKKEEQQKQGQPAQKQKPIAPQQAAEEDDENPFGGMKTGNFKKNLGCGG